MRMDYQCVHYCLSCESVALTLVVVLQSMLAKKSGLGRAETCVFKRDYSGKYSPVVQHVF